MPICPGIEAQSASYLKTKYAFYEEALGAFVHITCNTSKTPQ